MHIDSTVVLALAIVTHAWTSRIVTPPQAASVIGWVMNGVFMLVLALAVMHR